MDLTQAATPGYFATMALEHRVLERRARRLGPSPADYERNDTLTSLGMGVLSLVAPFVAAKVLSPLVPGTGRYGRALVATAVGAAAITTVADCVCAAADRATDDGSPRSAPASRRAAGTEGRGGRRAGRGRRGRGRDHHHLAVAPQRRDHVAAAVRA